MGVSRNVITRVEDAFKTIGMSWEEVKQLSDKEIDELLFPKAEANSFFVEPDFESIANELPVKGVTRKLL